MDRLFATSKARTSKLGTQRGDERSRASSQQQNRDRWKACSAREHGRRQLGKGGGLARPRPRQPSRMCSARSCPRPACGANLTADESSRAASAVDGRRRKAARATASRKRILAPAVAGSTQRVASKNSSCIFHHRLRCVRSSSVAPAAAGRTPVTRSARILPSPHGCGERKRPGLELRPSWQGRFPAGDSVGQRDHANRERQRAPLHETERIGPSGGQSANSMRPRRRA